MLKRYYTIKEASELLKIKQIDVVENVIHGTLRVCKFFHGWIGLFDNDARLFDREKGYAGLPTTAKGPYEFRGYLQISKESITIDRSSHRAFEELKYCAGVALIESLSLHEISDKELEKLPTEVDGYLEVFMECKLDSSQRMIIMPFLLEYDNALIPAQDLFDLSPKSKPNEKSFSTTERNSLLTIIGVIAIKGYGDDLAKPHALAKEIKKDADLLGISLSDDTIAQKLKEASKILKEKSQ